ncbi:MAG: hypothetical protein EAZ92_01540 [Candidatus Kapaibacterium sp.]|nr:MAG: hypothetical protein EAZ92_01540 [Candidatus Kapabacteria bacterium]
MTVKKSWNDGKKNRYRTFVKYVECGMYSA